MSPPGAAALDKPTQATNYLKLIAMIDVANLVKRYAGTEAVRGISFSVAKGEIVGFLGPNGAGKSTTMRMLTGYLPSTSGTIRIAGLEMPGDSVEIRRRIGYMPENVPLYPEMRVQEYLSYRAELKGVRRRDLCTRTDLAMQKCALTEVRNKIIGTLSKGFRQRVGLADSLVHDPGLLILDEPTAGLDPNQIRSVRDLIKELGKDHTILLSTHILSEVEMVCGRAIIINRGRIEASDSIENLKRRVQAGALVLEVKADRTGLLEKVRALSKVAEATVREEHEGWVRVECLSKPGEDPREEVDQLVKKEAWPLREFHRERASLEDVFVELTQE
jgi:ABC-2 type transport system ATP-binding protein